MGCTRKTAHQEVNPLSPKPRGSFHQIDNKKRQNPIGSAQQAASAASSTLLKIMIDTTSPPSCRLRAADSVLSHAAKAIEIEDIEARVAALEASAPQTNKRR
jgi:hypothetical protein